MSNTLIQEGGQGSDRINDTALHLFTTTRVGQVEILEDGTGFTTVNMQTKNATTLAFQASAQIAGSGNAPNFGTNHQKGEYIALQSDFQRITAIQLSAGSVRVYFT